MTPGFVSSSFLIGWWRCWGSRFILIIVLVSLTACMLGPNYQTPEVNVPSDWNSVSLTGDLGDLPVSMGPVPDVSWWDVFQNEELNLLIEQALERNHDLRQASFRVLEARALAHGAGAGLYPNMSVNGAYTRVRRSETILAAPTGIAPEGFAPPGANFDIWDAGIDLRWELDLWGKIRRSQEAFSAEAFASAMNRHGIALSLMSDVAQGYFRLRELDEQLEIASDNLALQQDSLSIITSRAEAGLVSDLDVKRAEILASETAAQLPELRRLRAVQQHQLELLTGVPPNTLDLNRQPIPASTVQPTIPIGLPADLLQRRPDIVEVEETLKAANARIGEARAYFFPTVALTGAGGFQTSEFDQWFTWASRNLSIGPSVSLPIFEGYTNITRLDVAESRYQQMLEQYQQTILTAFHEVADVLSALETRQEQLIHQQQQVQASQDARELAEIRYRQGLVTYLDVLDAQRTVLAAELNLVQTQRARLTDIVTLFKAIGGGWEEEKSPETKIAG